MSNLCNYCIIKWFCVLIIRLSVGCLGARFVIVLCIVHVFGAAHNKETAAADDLQIAADLSINRKAVTTSMMLLWVSEPAFRNDGILNLKREQVYQIDWRSADKSTLTL